MYQKFIKDLLQYHLKTLRLFDVDNLSQVKSDFDQTLRRSDAKHAVKG